MADLEKELKSTDNPNRLYSILKRYDFFYFFILYNFDIFIS
jgi:hypothetical protein